MRTPQDLPHPRATAARVGRGRWWIVAAVVVVIIVLASLKSVATLYTDSLWFRSVTLHRVWSTLLAVKVGLFASFGAVFFVLLWANLVVCDRLAHRSPSPDPEDELVRRYQRAVRPYTGRVHAAVALVLALIAASGTVGEWNNWILFTHATSFGVKDPQFGLDVGFFVFRLPFLEFLVNWSLVALVVVVAVTVVFHYLNGGIRLQRSAPRVRPLVKVHLSVLLALIALVKAAGYVLQRYQLDMSTNGYVEGAGYADVHARLPAIEVLFFISLFAAAILLYNIRRRGWTLPVLAIGLWAFVALVIGVIYPAVLQALKVNPAQSRLEQPYIKRNITATRAAYGLDHVQTTNFKGSTNTPIPASTLDSSLTTLENIRIWDPASDITQQAFQKKQSIKSYYDFEAVDVDRYTVDGTLRPVIVGVRQINPTDLPSSGWVNTHLQYTHGVGVVLAQANTETSDGNPTFAISDVPPVSSSGYPSVKAPYDEVYFGLNQSGDVVANTRQLELTYQKPTGTDVESHYAGTGGVPLSSWLTKAAFAVRLGDFNLLLSNLITPQSKMMFVRNVVTMAQKAAPFLSFDSDPYAAVVDGHIDWILNGYTTTANYPYSQNADTEDVPPGSGLPSSYNYVRNSVTVVVDAYTGKMTFYSMDNDPILRAYESAFPGMFTPAAKMPTALRAHLRYPENLFSIQAAVYGRYHITTSANFYTAGDAWTLSPTTGSGSPQNTLQVTLTTNAQGQVTGGSYQPMAPIYQVLQQPGEVGQEFTISDAYVPAGQSSQVLSAFMMADANPGPDYGQLHVYATPPGSSVNGPVLADASIQQTSTVSKTITQLDQHGSQVLLGNILMVPVGQSMIYVRPLYVVSSSNPEPQLKDVIAVLGGSVAMKPTLDGALDTLLKTNLLATTGSTSTTSGQPTNTGGVSQSALDQARLLLQEANGEFAKAETDLKADNLGAYGSDIQAGVALTQQAETELGQTTSSASGSTGTGSGTSSSSGGSTGSSSTGTSTGASGHGSSSSKSSSKSSSGGTTSTSSGKGSSSSAGSSPSISSGTTTTITVPGEA